MKQRLFVSAKSEIAKYYQLSRIFLICLLDLLHSERVLLVRSKFLTQFLPHLVEAQLCRLSPVDAHTVALKSVMGK